MMPADRFATMTMAEIFQCCPQVVRLFIRRRMACPGCIMAPFMTLAEAAAEYGIPPHELLETVRRVASCGRSRALPPPAGS